MARSLNDLSQAGMNAERFGDLAERVVLIKTPGTDYRHRGCNRLLSTQLRLEIPRWKCRNVALFRFVMNEGPGTTRTTLAAGIAAFVGPACALLPYTDYLPDFLKDLRGVWVLAAIGAIGIGVGVFAFRKGSWVAGTICVLTNMPVVAYWGFVAVFFSTGGSR
jgi:hypothetical protein